MSGLRSEGEQAWGGELSKMDSEPTTKIPKGWASALSLHRATAYSLNLANTLVPAQVRTGWGRVCSASLCFPPTPGAGLCACGEGVSLERLCESAGISVSTLR